MQIQKILETNNDPLQPDTIYLTKTSNGFKFGVTSLEGVLFDLIKKSSNNSLEYSSNIVLIYPEIVDINTTVMCRIKNFDMNKTYNISCLSGNIVYINDPNVYIRDGFRLTDIEGEVPGYGYVYKDYLTSEFSEWGNKFYYTAPSNIALDVINVNGENFPITIRTP